MEICIYCGYYIAGNANVAIAISITNPQDAHYFNRDPDVNDNAFIRAKGWAYNE